MNRWLATLLVLAIVMMALGGVERHGVDRSAGMQGIESVALNELGSIEDHHLDDLPSQPKADTPKSDWGSTAAGLWPAHFTQLAQGWGVAKVDRAALGPVLEGPLRPPRVSA